MRWKLALVTKTGFILKLRYFVCPITHPRNTTKIISRDSLPSILKEENYISNKQPRINNLPKHCFQIIFDGKIKQLYYPNQRLINFFSNCLRHQYEILEYIYSCFVIFPPRNTKTHKRLDKISFLMKEGRRSEISAVLNFFRTRKEDKNTKTVPLAFEVALKGTKTAFVSYENLKRDYPYVLIDFFEKKLKIGPNDGNTKDTAPQHKQNLNNNQPTRINTGLSNHRRRDHLSIPTQSQKLKQQYNFRQSKITRQANKDARQFGSRQRDRQTRQFSRQLRERDSKDYNSRQKDQFHHRQQSSRQYKTLKQQARPVRSCRFRNDLTKRKDEIQGKHQSGANIGKYYQQQDNNQINDQVSQALSEDEQFRRRSHKKILDYDYAIDNYQLYNLVSPAFIQASKSRIEPILPTYSLPMRINFKQVQREQYSSEQFKESEESQFVLDDRGKEKRRKEKLLRQQQRLNKKRRVKKIKKKKKPISRH